MATKNYRKDMARRVVDPKTFRKSSRIQSGNPMVHGTKESTDTGYKSSVYLGKTFESYYEVQLAGTETDLTLHTKKYRSIRVIKGTAYLLTIENPTDAKEEWKGSQHNLIPGDIIEFAPGKAYRVSTSSEDIEFVVTQDAKYSDALKTLEATESVGRITADIMREISRDDMIENVLNIPVRRGSKAREQLMAKKPGYVPQAVDPDINAPAGAIINKSPQAEMAELLAESKAWENS